jgi:hypothetical protein
MHVKAVPPTAPILFAENCVNYFFLEARPQNNQALAASTD